MKRLIASLLIFLLLLCGCKQIATDDEYNVTDVFFAGNSGREEPDHMKDLDLDQAVPVPDAPPSDVSGEELVVWYAMIRQVQNNGFLANHQSNPDHGLFYCWPGENTRWINAPGLDSLQMGDVVAITFDGCIDESYPGGLHRPEMIEKVSDPLENYLEQERLRLEKNTVHIYDFRVILKEYPLYGYSKTPLLDKPDFLIVSPIEVHEERNPENPYNDGGAPFNRIFYLKKQVRSVKDALGVIKELMGMPEVLQAWAVPAAT